MPSIIKPTGTSVDIQTGASSVGGATLVSVINTATTVVLVVDTDTGFNVWIGPGERIIMEKDSLSTLDGTAGSSPIYATPIAYKA